jgi:hypothetical protein
MRSRGSWASVGRRCSCGGSGTPRPGWPGRKKRIRPEQVEAIVNATLHTTPADATHWSVRTLAKRQRVSPATVHRIWQAHNLQPHRVETFKLSRDPDFVCKRRDIVGLYLNPPAKALMLSVDEKSQIQALDRTQPILPLRPGVPARWTIRVWCRRPRRLASRPPRLRSRTRSSI